MGGPLGKLIQAAQAWLKACAAPTVEDHTAQSAAALGIPPEMLAQVLAQQAPPPPDQDTTTCSIWPDTELPLALLQAMSNQWHLTLTGRLAGLRYEALPWAARSVGISPRRLTPHVLADLRVMETAAMQWEPPRD